MKKMKLLMGANGVALLAAIGSAHATVVDLTIGGGAIAGTTYGNSTVSATAGPITPNPVVLTVGAAPIDISLQTITFTTSGVANSSVYQFTLGTSFTVDGVSAAPTTPGASPGKVTGVGFLPNGGAELIINPGTPQIFDVTVLGQAYAVTLTTDPIPPNGGTPFYNGLNSSSSRNLTAEISVVAVPESSTVVAGAGALGLLILGIGVHSKRTVQRIG